MVHPSLLWAFAQVFGNLADLIHPADTLDRTPVPVWRVWVARVESGISPTPLPVGKVLDGLEQAPKGRDGPIERLK